MHIPRDELSVLEKWLGVFEVQRIIQELELEVDAAVDPVAPKPPHRDKTPDVEPVVWVSIEEACGPDYLFISDKQLRRWRNAGYIRQPTGRTEDNRLAWSSVYLQEWIDTPKPEFLDWNAGGRLLDERGMPCVRSSGEQE